MAESKKLDNRTFWSYTAGATGRDAAYALISMYLISYIQYTMNLTVAQFATLTGIIVLCRIWDAINDPLMGIIIENTHMKFGKFRPWILIGSLLNAAIIVALFTIRPTGWAFVGFFGVAYLLWGMTYTMNDISYWGMLPSLTSDAKERTRLITVMSIFICVGQFAVAGVIPMIVAGNAVSSYRWVALVVAAAFVLCQLLTTFGCVERHRATEDNVEHLSLKDMFKIIGRNDQLICSGIAVLLFQIGASLLIAFGMNFAFLQFGYTKGGSIAFFLTLMYGLGTLLSQCTFPLFVKYMRKKMIIVVSTITLTVFYILFFLSGFVIPMNAIALYVFAFMIFYAQGLFNMTLLVLLNNTIEYDEFKFHERHDSVISAVRSFATKLASALDQGITTLVLIVSGLYSLTRNIAELETEKGKGLLSAEEVLSKADGLISAADSWQLLVLRIGMCIVPIILLVVTMIILQKKYKIDEEMYENMVKELGKAEMVENK
ncbi:MAG: glycoside-pentoside-hexuronide (GPH):cation symporter [Treponemataceae bacterium]|nr:glycoside-pentoside-hexuronide (GPH):cation symporter [Treponemataceae bacterium]